MVKNQSVNQSPQKLAASSHNKHVLFHAVSVGRSPGAQLGGSDLLSLPRLQPWNLLTRDGAAAAPAGTLTCMQADAGSWIYWSVLRT